MSQQSEYVPIAFVNPFEALAYEFARFRWDFVRVVYSILAVQLLVAFGFAALVVNVPSVGTFFKGIVGLIIYILVILLALTVTIVLVASKNLPPVKPTSYILLGIFTVLYGFVVGFAASFTNAQLLAKAILALVVVVIFLFLYTLWLEKRDHQIFNFFVTFFISVLVIVLTFVIFQLLQPMEKVTDTIYCGAVVVIFSAYIILDTNSLLNRVPYYDFTWASILLSYLDFIRPFMIALSWVTNTLCCGVQLPNILRVAFE